MKYKILIVGLGNIGKRYFQGICKITDCKIDVFVFDNNPKNFQLSSLTPLPSTLTLVAGTTGMTLKQGSGIVGMQAVMMSIQ